MSTRTLRYALSRPTLAIGLLLLFGAACSDPGDEADHPILRSDKQRTTSPQVLPADFSAQVKQNNQLALDLYQQLRQSGKNCFFSPFSISSALAMLYGGARGTTESEMASALRFGLSQAKLHPFFNKLDLDLESRGQGAKAADGGPFRLKVANDVWGRVGHPFLPTYLDLLAENYGAGIHTLDFGRDAEGSRSIINRWVENQTEGRIKELMTKGSIASDTFLVLTNAIYLNAAWDRVFKKQATRPEGFDADGTPVTVSMMRDTRKTRYSKGAGYQAVELLYDGKEMSLLVILPDAGTFKTFQQKLDITLFDQIVSGLVETEVVLGLPRFEFLAPYELNKPLQALGMKAAFSSADFSGIDGGVGLLKVATVLHKAFVKVSEEGVEAAAATGISMDGGVSRPPNQVVLTIDRPFLYAIRDNTTGSVLFFGHTVNPNLTE